MLEIKHRFTGAVLHSGEFETIKELLANGIAAKKDLRYSDLRDSDLRYSNLRYSDLRYSNLLGSDLRGSDIADAYLPEGFFVARLDFGGWSVCIQPDKTSIGCQTHPNDKWLGWTPKSSEIVKMHDDAAKWWTDNQEAIKCLIKNIMDKQARWDLEHPNING